jgi:hypothetical protein
MLPATCVAAAVLACATDPRGRNTSDVIAARVEAVLVRRGLGPDTLGVIDNVVRHGTQEPPATSAIARELLARPPSAAEAAPLFARAVPEALRRFVGELSAPAQEPDADSSLRSLLDAYLGELVEVRRTLQGAAHGVPVNAQALLREVRTALPSPDSLRVLAGLDRQALERATSLFVEATARLVRDLRANQARLAFPERPLRFDSPIGVVSIGTKGNETHGPEAAVIIDPGGDDLYERAPVTGGSFSVIVDLAGEDRYRGSDLVLHGMSALIDLAGTDRYEMEAGLGAAIAGASVLVDLSGDDRYTAQRFGQGAAAFGFGALVDLGGDDAYRLIAGGQGFGLAGGIGLLWDREGSDLYTAAGLQDPFDRGGGLSVAQGAGFGFRTSLGGGIGILRDERGDDVYDAQMFAQGLGYYYGVGLLWDGAGTDRYRAVRYAQGNGVHEAIGVLRDESGSDGYELTVGVGQGMGLDLAVGILLDVAGDDRYAAPSLAQGAATANGIGIAADLGGADRFRMGIDEHGWGRAEWLRGLPSLGVLLYDPTSARFEREGKPVVPPPRSAELGGPLGGAPIAHEAESEPKCPEAKPGGNEAALRLVPGLLSISQGFSGGPVDPKVYGDVLRRLTTRLQASIAELPADSFYVTWSFGEALRCALLAASAEEAASMWGDMERVLAESPETPFAGVIADALHERLPPEPQMLRILRLLDARPRCSVREAALSLRLAAATDDAARGEAARRAQEALGSSCWRLQAQALMVLGKLGLEPGHAAWLPSFLRTGVMF